MPIPELLWGTDGLRQRCRVLPPKGALQALFKRFRTSEDQVFGYEPHLVLDLFFGQVFDGRLPVDLANIRQPR